MTNKSKIYNKVKQIKIQSIVKYIEYLNLRIFEY